MSDGHSRNQAIIDEFRANSGKVGGAFAGKTLLLLHTVGAKSGQERINPLAYVKEGDRLVIIVSKGGAPTHPDWYMFMREPQAEATALSHGRLLWIGLAAATVLTIAIGLFPNALLDAVGAAAAAIG